MLFLEASHSTIKIFEKYGVVKARAFHIASLSYLKSLVVSRFKENASLLFNIVIGSYIIP